MIAVRPRADQAAHPGERITVHRGEPDDPITLVEEQTFPERVHLTSAHRIKELGRPIVLHPDDSTWLHAVLAEMIGAGDEIGIEDAEPARLLAHHRSLTRLISEEQDEAGSPRNPVVHQALTMRRAEVERALAVSNVRAARAEDEIADLKQRLLGMTRCAADAARDTTAALAREGVALARMKSSERCEVAAAAIAWRRADSHVASVLPAMVAGAGWAAPAAELDALRSACDKAIRQQDAAAAIQQLAETVTGRPYPEVSAELDQLVATHPGDVVVP